MNRSISKRSENFERRLTELKEEARRNGNVDDAGTRAMGGPLPSPSADATPAQGYLDQPIVKPPVWEWMIAVYFFVGGMAGMSGLIAAAAWLNGYLELVRIAMWTAGVGAVLSPILLIWDLGRPMRFIYMLRVFKYQSPMSVGSWVLTAFGVCALPGLLFTEWHWQNVQSGHVSPAVHWLAIIGMGGSALIGPILGTYTGALVAVTSVPAWNAHPVILPFQFGMAALGSAAAIPLISGIVHPALQAILLIAAAAETVVQFVLAFRKRGAVDRALHEGRSGWILRTGETLAGPLALILAGFGLLRPAAGSFLVGALIVRFGWLSAGRASAADPEAVRVSPMDS